MRYSELQLNEGIVQNVIMKVKGFYGKVKSIVSGLNKFNFKQFSAENKAAIKPIADKVLKAILAGEKVDVEFVSNDLRPIIYTPKVQDTIKTPTNEAMLNEDVRGAVEKMFAELAATFMGFVSILQADEVINRFRAFEADPSAMHNYMLQGTSACLLFLLTGLAMCFALRYHFKTAEKSRHELEDLKASRA